MVWTGKKYIPLHIVEENNPNDRSLFIQFLGSPQVVFSNNNIKSKGTNASHQNLHDSEQINPVSSLKHFRLLSSQTSVILVYVKKLRILSYVLPLPLALQGNQLSIGPPSGVGKLDFQKEKPVQFRSTCYKLQPASDNSSWSLFFPYSHYIPTDLPPSDIFMTWYRNIIPVASDRVSHDLRHFELKNARKFASCTQRGLNEHYAWGNNPHHITCPEGLRA